MEIAHGLFRLLLRGDQEFESKGVDILLGDELIIENLRSMSIVD